MKEVFESLEAAIAFDSSDWSSDKRKAWIYGIVVGWDETSIQELKDKFGWSDETVERLKRLRQTVAETMNTD